MIDTCESRPGTGTEAAESVSQALPKILPASEVLARARRADYVVRVRVQRADGVVLVQHYSSLQAAERRVRRAHERHLAADICLCRVTPIVGSVEVGDVE